MNFGTPLVEVGLMASELDWIDLDASLRCGCCGTGRLRHLWGEFHPQKPEHCFRVGQVHPTFLEELRTGAG